MSRRRDRFHDDPHRGRPAARRPARSASRDGDGDLPGLDAERLPPRAGRAAERGDRRARGTGCSAPGRASGDGAGELAGRRPGDDAHPRALAAAALRGARLRPAARPRGRVEIDGKALPDLATRWDARADPPRRLHVPTRPPHAGRRGRGARQPARPGAGVPQPLRRPPVGLRLATACVLRVLRDNVEPDPPGLRRVRPRGDDGRRGLRRLRAALAASATRRASRASGPRSAGSSSGRRRRSEQGTRALDELRDGVEAAIAALGPGFLAHPGERRAARGAPRRASSTRRTTTASCCASSTGSSSCSSPRTATCCSTPTPSPTAQRALPRATTRPRGCARSPSAAAAARARRPLARRCGSSMREARRRRRLPRARPAGRSAASSGRDEAIAAPRRRRARQRRPARRGPRARVHVERRQACCAPSTTATSAPRSSAASTSRCSSCTPSSTPTPRTFELDDRRRQRAQDHRQLLHARRA